MKMKDYLDGDVVTMEIGGKIIRSDALTSLRGRVQYYLSLNKKCFVVDLQHVDWMSSAGLGALISAYTSVKRADGRFVLANITNIQDLLSITQLLRVFDTFDSRSEAQQAVRTCSRTAS